MTHHDRDDGTYMKPVSSVGECAVRDCGWCHRWQARALLILGLFWDHDISIIVTSIITDLTVFKRKLGLNSLSIMEIMNWH
jgi:hypothetical protein